MSNHNKIVFLDIDGPMIPSRAYFLPNQTKLVSVFDPCAVAMLNKLTDASGALIVISSTWAIHGFTECFNALKEQGVTGNLHPDWKTPRKLSSSRTSEISMWLMDHPEITDYVALDDEMLDASILPGFVQCDMDEGFSFRNYLESKILLGISDESDIQRLLHLCRKEIWRTQRHGDTKEHLTWRFADEMFPVDPESAKPHLVRGK